MADVDIRVLRNAATQRARQQLDHIDFSSLADHLPKNVNVDWNIIREREERAASRGFLGGFLLGGLLGIVLALVFAPRRGVETRDLVASTAGDIRDKAFGLVGGSGESSHTSGVLDDVKDEVGAVIADLSEKGSETVEDLKNVVSDAGDEVDEAGTEIEGKVGSARKPTRSAVEKTKNKLDA